MSLNHNSERIATMQDSIFTTISQMAIENKALNLGQGFPNFDGPSFVKGGMTKALMSGLTQYAAPHGIISFRKLISEQQKNHYDLEYDIERQVTITTGATEALYCAIMAFINPNDEVVIFEPFYDAYKADVVLAGGIPRYVTLHKPDFSFDFSEFERAINKKTKMIIVNSPHNPTGKVFSRKELEFIAEVAKKNDLIVLSDEAYEFLTFNKEHIPIASLEGMMERTLSVYSSGKTFGMTGLKVGYVCANDNISHAIRKVHQWVTFTVNTPSQYGIAEGFRNLDEYIPKFKEEYLAKRNLMLSLLKQTPFKAYQPDGTYFILIDIPRDHFYNDVDAATRLIKEHKVATIPTSVFYARSDEGSSMLRLCFAKNDDTIIEGIARLNI